MNAKAAIDPMIQKSYLFEIAGSYLNGADPRTPLRFVARINSRAQSAPRSDILREANVLRPP
jgi:hypothetical protein